jgi:hypothetical protein
LLTSMPSVFFNVIVSLIIYMVANLIITLLLLTFRIHYHSYSFNHITPFTFYLMFISLNNIQYTKLTIIITFGIESLRFRINIL